MVSGSFTGDLVIEGIDVSRITEQFGSPRRAARLDPLEAIAAV